MNVYFELIFSITLHHEKVTRYSWKGIFHLNINTKLFYAYMRIVKGLGIGVSDFFHGK